MAELVILQFDVCAAPEGSGKVAAAVALQSHLLPGMTTTLIAPLLRTADRPDEAGALVEIEFAGESLTLSLVQMTSIPTRRLRKIGSVASQESQIRRGLDRLFTGF